MTEQPPRSTIEKVQHHYSRLSRETAQPAAGKAIEEIQSIFKKSATSLIEYVPAGLELEKGLLCHREAFLWMIHAVTVNPSDNSSADGKLVENV